MTWGDIEATPMRIEAEDLPPGPLIEGGWVGCGSAGRRVWVAGAERGAGL